MTVSVNLSALPEDMEIDLNDICYVACILPDKQIVISEVPVPLRGLAIKKIATVHSIVSPYSSCLFPILYSKQEILICLSLMAVENFPMSINSEARTLLQKIDKPAVRALVKAITPAL